MIIFYIFLLIILISIAIIDYAISEIPNVLNGALGVLGLIYYFINIKINWWLPLVLAISTFAVLFIFFLITDEALIGAGDTKMITVSMLFINSFSSLYYYLIWFSIFALIGVIVAFIKKEKGVRCGPYLGLALFFTLIQSFINFNQGMYIASTFMILTIILSYVYLAFRGECLDNEKIKLF